MVLDGKERQHFVSESFNRTVVQIYMRDGHRFARGTKRVGLDGVAVVFCTDRDLLRREILAWLIAAVVTELEFAGATPERQAEDLVSEANAKGGLRANEFPHVFPYAFDSGGIARAVRKEDRVGVERQDFGGRGRRRDHGHVKAMIGKQTQDVLFNAEVVRHEFKCRTGSRIARELSFDATPATFRPRIGFATRHLGDEVSSVEARCALREREQRRFILLFRVRAEHANLRAVISDAPNQCAGIDPRNAGHPRSCEVVTQAAFRAIVAGCGREFFDHKAR